MSRKIRFALVGLQTGVSGALMMLLWLAASSVWSRRSIWWMPNLAATTFYGEAALRSGFGRYTMAGIALALVLYGVLGILFGLAVREHPWSLRLAGLGAVVGIAAYVVLVRMLWKSTVPLANLYSPDRQLLIGHFLYGLVLARFPGNLAGRRTDSEPSEPPPGPSEQA
jgi:hypothetical protein